MFIPWLRLKKGKITLKSLFKGITHTKKKSLPYKTNKLKEFKKETKLNIVDLTQPIGKHCTAWYKKAEPGKPTIVFFHGNANNLLLRQETLKNFTKKGYGVMAIDYRGYNKAGKPTEQGLYNDARAAINELLYKQNIPAHKIQLYGESLGTGVASQMACEYDLGGLTLDCPYSSMQEVAKETVPKVLQGLTKNITYKFDTVSKIKKISEKNTPITILVAGQDKDTPPDQAIKLLENASNTQKPEKLTHNDEITKLKAGNIHCVIQYNKSHLKISDHYQQFAIEQNTQYTKENIHSNEPNKKSSVSTLSTQDKQLLKELKEKLTKNINKQNTNKNQIPNKKQKDTPSRF